MRLIRTSEYRRMPWKNGGGETMEIIASPTGAPLNALDWRISIAKVASDGPFSIFPSMERTLTLIEGPGLDLAFTGRGTVRVDRTSIPFAFPADIQVDARLVDGTIEDLNVMTRRGRFRHHVARLRTAAPVTLAHYSEEMLVLVRGAGALVRINGAAIAAGNGDAILLSGREAASLEVRPDGDAELFTVDLWRI